MRHRTVAQANERGGDNGETQSNATLPAPRNAAEVPILSGGDVRDLLIAQQVRRIDELERQVDELSRELRKLSAPHGDAGSDPMGASGETRA